MTERLNSRTGVLAAAFVHVGGGSQYRRLGGLDATEIYVSQFRRLTGQHRGVASSGPVMAPVPVHGKPVFAAGEAGAFPGTNLFHEGFTHAT